VSEFLGFDALSIERGGNKRNSQDTCQAEAESRQRTALDQGESVDGFASLTLFKVTPTDRKRGYQLPRMVVAKRGVSMRVGISGLTHLMISLASVPSDTASAQPRARAPNDPTS